VTPAGSDCPAEDEGGGFVCAKPDGAHIHAQNDAASNPTLQNGMPRPIVD
jgi:hypothetical protein